MFLCMYVCMCIWREREREKAILPPGGSNVCTCKAAAADTKTLHIGV